jgi:hypothetical protein
VVSVPSQNLSATQFGSGTYLIGSGVTPGDYVTEGADWCYRERSRRADGAFGSIIAKWQARGHTTVTIRPSDKAFKVAGGCTFTKR